MTTAAVAGEDFTIPRIVVDEQQAIRGGGPPVGLTGENISSRYSGNSSTSSLLSLLAHG